MHASTPDFESLLLLGLLAVGACQSEPQSGGWTGRVDTLTSGRVVVHNPDTPLWQPGEQWQLRERFRLGSSEPDSPELFGEIADVEIGPAGEIYVLDGQALQVRVFDSTGTFLRSFGRRGSGPGELSWPGGMALDTAGTLWVVDFGNRRYQGFDPGTGGLVAEKRRDWRYFATPWPGGMDRSNHLIDVGSGGGGPATLIFRLDSSFTPVDTMVEPSLEESHMVTYSQNGLPQMSVPDPFAPRPAWALLPEGGIVAGDGERLLLHRITFNGDTTATIEIQRRPIPITAAEKDSALQAFQAMVRMHAEGATPERDPRVPANRPAHGRIFADDQGFIWVAQSSGNVWDVIDSAGRYLGAITLPPLSASASTPARRGNRLAMASEVDGLPMVLIFEITNPRSEVTER